MNRNDAPPHILAWIKTGISAVIPIKVELIGFKASIHFEFKITGISPFVSAGRFSFLNFPLYETSIMPLIPMNIAQVFLNFFFFKKKKVSYYKTIHSQCNAIRIGTIHVSQLH